MSGRSETFLIEKDASGDSHIESNINSHLVETALSDLNVGSPWFIIPKKVITRTDITVARKVYVVIFDH